MPNVHGKIKSFFEGTPISSQFEYKADFAPNKREILEDFIHFAQQKLGIKQLSKYIFVPKKDNDMSTGCYMPGQNIIKVLIGNRALLDIIRSVGHEMVHRQQDETGKLQNIGTQGDRSENDMSDVGVDFENEANALGGALVKEWSRKYNKIPADRLYEL